MRTDRKYETIKENRGWYFTEYYPCINSERFAVLQLIFLNDSDQVKVAETMELELSVWLERYPLPIMVSAFDKIGDLINLGQVRPCNHLIGFFDDKRQICLYWQLLKDDEIPDVALNQEYIDELYSGLTYTTSIERQAELQKKLKQKRIGWVVFFLWLVVIPAIIEIFEYYSDLLSLVALIYSLSKAVQKGLELTGKWPKTKRAKERELEEQLKSHYYYHCQMNPEGFRKLTLENFNKLSANEITKEAEFLKR